MNKKATTHVVVFLLFGGAFKKQRYRCKNCGQLFTWRNEGKRYDQLFTWFEH